MRLRRAARNVGFGLAAFVIAVAALTVATAELGDPALWPPRAGEPSTDIYVVSHGYHAGLALPTARVAEVAGRQGNAALIAVAQRFAGYPFIEMGWGDEAFYSSVRDVSSLTPALALRALFLPGNGSVMHVVGLIDTPRRSFASADIVRVPVSQEGFDRMMRSLDASFVRSGEPAEPTVIGKGLYGPSLFYRANGSFSILHVCNHWVAELLSVAGLPRAPVLGTLPDGLLLDLKMRSGLDRLPAIDGARS